MPIPSILLKNYSTTTSVYGDLFSSGGRMTDAKDSLPDGSICGSCDYFVGRVIVPLDDEAYEIYIQEDPDSNIFVHVSCAILEIDLHDHVVTKCTKFRPTQNLFNVR